MSARDDVLAAVRAALAPSRGRADDSALPSSGGGSTAPAAPVSPPAARFAITPPATLPLKPSLQAAARDFAVAPDGSFLVYRAGDLGQLAVRWFDRLDAVPLAGVAGAVAVGTWQAATETSAVRPKSMSCVSVRVWPSRNCRRTCLTSASSSATSSGG